MKTIFLLWAATFCLSLSLHAAPGGTVNFANRGFDWEAPVLHADGVTRVEGEAFRAQLWAGPAPGQLQPAGEPVPLRAGAGAGFFFGGTRQIPTVPAGQLAFIQVRVWDSSAGSTFEDAFAAGAMAGVSTICTVLTGGGGSPPSVPSNLTGLQSFQIDGVGIVRQPARQTAFQGAQVQFSVEVTSSSPSEFQWQFNGVDLPGATGPALQLAAQPESEGLYRVAVNAGGRILLSQSASLTVIPVPSGAVLFFGNRLNDAMVSEPLLDASTGQPLSGDFVIQLLAGLDPEELLPASDPTPVASGANAGLWEGTVLSIPDAAPGQEVFLQLRAWQLSTAATYEEASLLPGSLVAVSEICSVLAGGNGIAPAFLPPELFKLTFKSWDVVVEMPPLVIEVIPPQVLPPEWPDEFYTGLTEVYTANPLPDDFERPVLMPLPIGQIPEYTLELDGHPRTISLITGAIWLTQGGYNQSVLLSPPPMVHLPSELTLFPEAQTVSIQNTSLSSSAHTLNYPSSPIGGITVGAPAPVPPPQTASSFPGSDSARTPPRGKLLRVSASSDTRYEIEASTDLHHWFPIATQTSASGNIDLSSLPRRAEPILFFRARALDRDDSTFQTSASAALASPAQPSTAPRIMNPRRQNSQFAFELEAANGEEWLVEYTDSLSAPDWKPLQRISTSTLNSTVTDSATAPGGRYYRVRTP